MNNLHLRKFNFYKHYEIIIDRVDCNFENISKAVNIFKPNNVLLTIDSIGKSSPLFAILDSLKLDYSSTPKTAEINEVSVLVPYELLYRVLVSVIFDDPENIFMTHLNVADNWMRFQYSTPQELLIKGDADLNIIIGRDKRIIFLSFKKNVYNHKDVLNEIRSFFD